MPMRIMVTRGSCKVLDEENPVIEKRTAEYHFTATLQNTGNESIYDADVTLNCSHPIHVTDYYSDLLPNHQDANAASFRLSVPIHPNDRERHVSWLATAKPYPCINGVEPTRIRIEFIISAKDRQPETYVVEFDGHDRIPQTKQAERVK